MRIIAGTARGRRLETPDTLDTRPTLGRVREALFGSLHFQLEGAAVLDLFAGAGSLGLEALSRGAAVAVLNDADRRCFDLLKKNIYSTGLVERAELYCLDYRQLLDKLEHAGRRFDIAFLDPPYRSGFAQDAAEQLFSRGLMKRGGTVIIEHGKDNPPKEAPGLFHIQRTRRYGGVYLATIAGEDQA